MQKLKNKIADKAIKDEVFRYTQKKSISVLDGKPDAVNHSTVKASASELQKQNTTHYGTRLEIINNQNGTCSIITDLSAVGMEGLSAIEYFKCGQTKMEKAYDIHMKNVLKKFGKANDN